jgi:hypothetical protein
MEQQSYTAMEWSNGTEGGGGCRRSNGADAGCPHHDAGDEAGCATAAMEADADGWLVAGMRHAGVSFYFDRQNIWKVFTIQTQINLWCSGELFQT